MYVKVSFPLDTGWIQIRKKETKNNCYFLVVPSLFPRSTVHKRARPPLFFLSICLHCFPGHIFSMRFCSVFPVDVSAHTVSSNNSPTFFIWTNNKTSYTTHLNFQLLVFFPCAIGMAGTAPAVSDMKEWGLHLLWMKHEC